MSKKNLPNDPPESPESDGPTKPETVATDVITPDSALSSDNDAATLPGIAEAHSASYEGFDPSIHAINDDGTPKKKTDGSYALKRGRKANSAASALPPKNAPQNVGVGVRAENSVTISADEAARQSANLVINVAVWTLGEEVGKPIDKAEADGLKLSFKNYYDVRGVPNIPPEIGLILALGSYMGPRLMHEKSQSKMDKVKLWLASKIGK